MRAKSLLALGFFVSAAGISSGCATTASNKPEPGATSSSTSTKLVKADIVGTNLTSAYDVINRLRPTWLRPAGMTITGMNSGSAAGRQVLVYLDGIQYGAIESLRNITTNNLVSIEFLNPTQAATQVRDNGASVASAIIMVRTR